jgi:hypothetical protein
MKLMDKTEHGLYAGYNFQRSEEPNEAKHNFRHLLLERPKTLMHLQKGV